MTETRCELLIVDDEPLVLSALQRALRRSFGARVQVTVTPSAAEALRWVAERPFAAVISDLRMPEMDGLTLLALTAALQPHAALLLLTGSADFAVAQRAVNQVGVFRYLTKPWQDDELLVHLQAALEHSEASRRRADQADAWAREQGQLSAQDAERRRLEAIEPGITQVEWGPQGEVLMPALESRERERHGR
ncbi:MAG: response regulator [Rubrivivax sp.]|nr:response regulator [Rubrivivax sp.]